MSRSGKPSKNEEVELTTILEKCTRKNFFSPPPPFSPPTQ